MQLWVQLSAMCPKQAWRRRRWGWTTPIPQDSWGSQSFLHIVYTTWSVCASDNTSWPALLLSCLPAWLPTHARGHHKGVHMWLSRGHPPCPPLPPC